MQHISRSKQDVKMDQERSFQLSRHRGQYCGLVKLHGEAHGKALLAATNYSSTLKQLKRFKEAKTLLRKTIPVARRVLGADNTLTLKMRVTYAVALYDDTDATLDDVREAVTTLTETVRIARRVLGGADPDAMNAERELRYAQLRAAATLAACNTLAHKHRFCHFGKPTSKRPPGIIEMVEQTNRSANMTAVANKRARER